MWQKRLKSVGYVTFMYKRAVICEAACPLAGSYATGNM